MDGNSSAKTKVFVTGASGKTGALVVQQLLQLPDKFEVAVAVRSDKAHKYMVDLGVTPDNIFHLDLSGSDESRAALQAALQGCQALVICTAAVPEVALLSTLLGGLWFWAGSTLAGLLGRHQQPPEGAAGGSRAADPFVPVAKWKAGQTPEKVDYQGQVAQIEAAKASSSVQHVVLISSAGGCDPHHFLNHIGKDAGGGDILNWKRKAEQHLIASGLPYTILHPNHLVDPPAGRHVVALAVDDALQQPHWRQRLKMPRADLAALAVQCLLLKDAGGANRSIDCAARPAAAGEAPTTTTEQFKQLLQQMPDSCSYSINDRTKPDAEWACTPAGQN
ncbi:hypothetical protein OEZ85_011871 [Tetradesmus obliquus]|uniref:NAD(P)-binding domain-containing protein n=1 Tax=Tetradesmus obliquus TaxID=3088 RepID=A0ABY8TTY5_TETOB|nr:hypothetical protein OEZ85_011871 [Tetradesmus obliquus]